MEKEVFNFVKINADEIIGILSKSKNIMGGENGPYNDHETPVRVSAHWIIIFNWLYNKTHEKKYIDSIKIIAEYLYNAKETNLTYCCRNKENKDHVNGTIGEAWVIEGLIEAAKCLNDDKYYELAVNIFLNHSFNEKIGCWNRMEIDGKILGFDETFNHQLWFAAAGVEILSFKDNLKIREQVNCFLDKCIGNKLFRIHNNGLIRHYSCITDCFKHFIRYRKIIIKDNFNNLFSKPSLKYKEEGYHYFALYGFAIIYNDFANHKIFKTRKMKKAIQYGLNENNYLKLLKQSSNLDGTGLAKKFNLECNIYAFPYNSPSFELPFILKNFDNEKNNYDIIEKLWYIQKDLTMDNNYKLVKNTNDTITLTSRIYELLRAL